MTDKIFLTYDLSTFRIQKLQIPRGSYPTSVICEYGSSPKLIVYGIVIWDEPGHERKVYDLSDTYEIELLVIKTNEQHNTEDLINFLGSFVYANEVYHVGVIRRKSK